MGSMSLIFGKSLGDHSQNLYTQYRYMYIDSPLNGA